jgi:hypothetical protein
VVVLGGQAGSGMSRRVRNALASARVQGQCSARRRKTLRWPRVLRQRCAAAGSAASWVRRGAGRAGRRAASTGVRPVPGFQERDLSAAGVGGEALVAVAVADLEGVQGRAGMRQLTADENPDARAAGGPARQVEQAGDVGDVGVLPQVPVDVARDLPGPLRDGAEQHRALDPLGGALAGGDATGRMSPVRVSRQRTAVLAFAVSPFWSTSMTPKSTRYSEPPGA